MLVSCKISNSVLSYLEHEGCDLGLLLERVALPEDFLRDTSYWMPADEMESFLDCAEKLYPFATDSDFIEKMAHSVPELRAWGLLDSVLRMMPKPQDILAQPERFLSYFVSPQPPVENVQRSEHRLEFDLPIHSDQYPQLTHYFRSAFETLPVFSGQPPAKCRWDGIHFEIVWSGEQVSIFTEIDVGRQISPELLQSVVASLEQTQRDLNQLRAQKENVPDSNAEEVRQELRRQLAKLSDYMVRAQQLITLLVGQNRMSPGVKEAMRRVDWERVVQHFPRTIELCQKLLTQPRESWTLKDFILPEPSSVESVQSVEKTPRRRSSTSQQQEMFHVENSTH